MGLWNPLLWKAILILITQHLIHMEFENLGGLVILVTFAYCRGTVLERRVMWMLA